MHLLQGQPLVSAKAQTRIQVASPCLVLPVRLLVCLPTSLGARVAGVGWVCLLGGTRAHRLCGTRSHILALFLTALTALTVLFSSSDSRLSDSPHF